MGSPSSVAALLLPGYRAGRQPQSELGTGRLSTAIATVNTAR